MDIPTKIEQKFTDNIQLLNDLFNKTLKQLLDAKILKIHNILKDKALILEQIKNNQDQKKLIDEIFNIIQKLEPNTILILTRIYTLSLNLTNIVEQYHRIRRRRWHQSTETLPQPGSLEAMFLKMNKFGIKPEEIEANLRRIHIDLVLTAHPTEVIRRTMMHKYNEIAKGLEFLDREDLTPNERERAIDAIHEEITAAYITKEIRHEKPTPLEEAKWGYAVIEESLWQAYPEFMRDLDKYYEKYVGKKIDIDMKPIRFSSWMGGDRDGNPNVTAEITRKVVLTSRWKAADLFWHDINQLREALSMNECNAELRRIVGPVNEPYRFLLRSVKERLLRTKQWAECHLEHGELCPSKDLIYLNTEDLLEPLLLCYRSLKDCGAEIIADGRLLDIIRKIKCFGLTLLPLDIRQHAEKHQDLLNALTINWNLGPYTEWSEEEKINFFIKNFNHTNCKIKNFDFLDIELKEIVLTLEEIVKTPPDSYGAYIVSMAANPSDILAVYYLQKLCGIQKMLRVVPLFETLEDLNHACVCMEQLFSIPEYRNITQGKQEVMIGYSDSAKDAGFLAASFAQYQAQLEIFKVAQKHNYDLIFFHGRGGSIGRGGGPSHLILRTQPQETFKGQLRMTQQGEVIRYRFGLQKIAERTLSIFLTNTLESLVFPNQPLNKSWYKKMQNLSQISFSVYQKLIANEEFIQYFKQVTPVNEFDKITIASRPTKRGINGGIEHLRAIPWVFAWTQNQLILPAWYGIGEALQHFNKLEEREDIRDIIKEWPYFASLMTVIHMELAKVSTLISKEYEEKLADKSLWALGDTLRQSFAVTKQEVLNLLNQKDLLEVFPYLKKSIKLRAPELLLLHLLQIHCLKNCRVKNNDCNDNEYLKRALMVSITGIATGMQNTG